MRRRAEVRRGPDPLQAPRVLRKPRRARTDGAFKKFWKKHRGDIAREGILGLTLAVIAFSLAVYWDGQVSNRQEMLENTRFVRQVSIDEKQQKPFIGMYLRGASLTGLTLDCDYRPEGRTPEPAASSLEPQTDPRSDAGCADFGGADLKDADLRSADLRGASLFLADARRAKFQFARMQNITVARADFRGANLIFAELQNAKFEEVKLSGASIGLAEFEGTKLHEVDLSRSTTLVGAVNFTGAELVQVNFRGADLYWADGLETATLDRICHDRTTLWPDGFQPPKSDCSYWGWW